MIKILKASWACVWSAVKGLGQIIKSMLTGPDNKSWAPGRIMGFGVFIIGQCLAIRASQAVLTKGLSAPDWVTFLNGVATFEALDCTTAVGLVLGMAPTDPFGKWWDRDAGSPSDAVSAIIQNQEGKLNA